MNTTEFTKKLKEQRILKGESQSDLGIVLGVGVKQIQRYETGELPPPHESLELLCHHYDFDFISLLYDFKGFDSNRKIIISGTSAVGKSAILDHIIEKLLKEKDLTAQKIEEKYKVAEEYAKEMKHHYEDAKSEKNTLLKTLNRNQDLLDKAQNAIIEVLKPIKEKTEELLTNSNTTLDRLSIVETIVRSDDTVIMNNQDRQNGNEVGTSAKEAGSRQIAADKMRKGKGNQTGARS
jgi:transcriptional regulator with XRE-family HTH domain